MKIPEIEFGPLDARRWAYRAAWVLGVVMVVLYVISAWALPPLEQSFALTGAILQVPIALCVLGGVWVGYARVEDRFGYGGRVERRRPICVVAAIVVLLVQLVLSIAAAWADRHAGDLSQTAAALIPVLLVSVLMAVDWEEMGG